MHPHLIYKYMVCYAMFFLLNYLSKLDDGNKLVDDKGLVRQPGILFGLHISGIFWLGLIGTSILHKPLLTVAIGNEAPGLWQTVVLLPFLFISIVFSWLQGLRYKIFNEQTSSGWFPSVSFTYKYFALRIIFLILYEIWFRGFLLTDSIAYFGTFIAILLNIFLYALLHVFAGRKEMLACIPFGILLCCLCIWLKAAWPAILLHLCIAIPYERTLLKRFMLMPKVAV